jgi:hypothetical protein
MPTRNSTVKNKGIVASNKRRRSGSHFSLSFSPR